MNWRAIRAIVRKDLKVVLQNKGVTIPMILLPLILFVVLPALAAFLPSLGSMSASSASDLQSMFQNVSGQVVSRSSMSGMGSRPCTRVSATSAHVRSEMLASMPQVRLKSLSWNATSTPSEVTWTSVSR